MNWQPIHTAPKGVYSESINDANYVRPPLLLLVFPDNEFLLCRWDFYYDLTVGGYGAIDGYDA